MFDNGGISISHRRKHQIIKDAFRVAIREIMKSHPNARLMHLQSSVPSREIMKSRPNTR